MKQDGSKVWNAESQTVIASLAFHPFEKLLVIATNNEIHFWDWSRSEPFAVISTKTNIEKVRWVLVHCMLIWVVDYEINYKLKINNYEKVLLHI